MKEKQNNETIRRSKIDESMKRWKRSKIDEKEVKSMKR